jgi:hypothetical protein
MPLDPLRVVYVWPAPKSRFVVSGLSRTRATLAGANAPRIFGSCILFLRTTLSCRSALARDLPGTGSKSCACGMSGNIESPDFATAARQIAGQATLLQVPCGFVIVPTLRVVMPARTLRVQVDAERQSLRYHAERGNDQNGVWTVA